MTCPSKRIPSISPHDFTLAFTVPNPIDVGPLVRAFADYGHVLITGRAPEVGPGIRLHTSVSERTARLIAAGVNGGIELIDFENCG